MTAAGAARHPAQTVRPSMVDGNRVFRVLVVDDDADLRLIVRMVLDASSGFHVVAEASDGGEAIEVARFHQPDLVLLDLSMPRTDGLSALLPIRQAAPATKVVVLSGYARGHLAADAAAGGAVGYLEKTGSFRGLVDELLAVGGVLEVVELVLDEHRATLAAELRSAGVARRFVDRALERWSCGDVLDVVSLLVSELVANAVLHAGSQVEVTVQLKAGTVRIEVLDEGEDLPHLREAADHATSGRGLAMVEALSLAWGADQRDGGKAVWFEVPRPDAAPAAAPAVSTGLP